MTNPDNADVCPHGVRRELAWCARCADPAFDAARGGEAVAAAMNTKTLTFGGEAPFTSNEQTRSDRDEAQRAFRRHHVHGMLVGSDTDNAWCAGYAAHMADARSGVRSDDHWRLMLRQVQDQRNAAQLENRRLSAALEEIRGVKLLTDCGIHPMRAAGIRHAFEITAEIATKALSGER